MQHQPKIISQIKIVTYLLITIAFSLLIIQYASNLSVWRDEAALANNIVQRSYPDLFQILDNTQAAPLGFLLTTKLITSVLGTSEYALRLLSLIYGLLSIVLFVLVEKEVNPLALVFGLALLATSPLHLRYSAEFKQYIGDSFWSLFLLYLAFRYIRQPNNRILIYLLIVGCISVWFSHPAIFVLAGIGTVFFINGFFQKDYVITRKLFIVGILWLFSFLAVYLISYQTVVSGTELSTNMNNYWNDKFLELNLSSALVIFFEIFTWVGGLFQPALLILVIFGMIIGIKETNAIYVYLLITPILFMLFASIFELYPIANRMILFMIPNLIILTSIGWWQVFSQIFRLNYRIGWWILLFVLIGLLARIEVPFTTTDTTEAREALAWIETEDEDPLLILTGRLQTITTYYGYAWQSYANEIPDDQRYWIVTENPIPAIVTLDSPHSSYYFRATTVICFPYREMTCPDKVNDSR